MSITVIRSTRLASFLFTGAAALAMVSCAGNSPTEPSPSNNPSPTTPAPGGNASVNISVNPNPVPFSGTPITDTPQCAGYALTWFYDQVIQETSGRPVTFTSRVDLFDDKVANNITTGLNIAIPANGALSLRTRWCSGSANTHTAQTTFSGTDANGNRVTATGPVVRLMPGPGGK